MVVVTGVLVALLVLGAGVLWPVRARHEVVLGLADLAGRRERAARQQATVASVRGLLAVDPVAATGTGVRGLLGRARARFGTVRVTDDAVLRLLDGLSSALSAGLPPHAALEVVAQIEASAEALRAKGLRLLYDAPRRGTAGSRVNFVHPKDAGGVLVELVEPAADPTH